MLINIGIGEDIFIYLVAINQNWQNFFIGMAEYIFFYLIALHQNWQNFFIGIGEDFFFYLNTIHSHPSAISNNFFAAISEESSLKGLQSPNIPLNWEIHK